MKRFLTILGAMMASAVLVTAQETTKAQEYKSVMYNKGYRADIELGTGIASQYDITTSHGYSFGNGLYVGGGVGFGAEFKHNFKTSPVFYAPVFADVKYNFLNQKCTPFVGLRLGEIADITNRALRTSVNPNIGIDIASFSIKVGYDFQWNAIGYGNDGMGHYARISVGYTF